jgi:hypothetical protein
MLDPMMPRFVSLPHRLPLLLPLLAAFLLLAVGASGQLVPLPDNGPPEDSVAERPRPPLDDDLPSTRPESGPPVSYLPFSGGAEALPDENTISRERFFRVGYLTPSSESALGQKWHMELRQAMREHPAFSKAMADANLIGVALRPCDHPEDMLERMVQQEFDLVFSPAMVYAQERLARGRVQQTSRYRAVFQTRRQSTDSADIRRGEGPTHRGALFVRRDYRLGVSPGGADPAKLRELIAGHSLAVSGSYDAAGFFYIRKLLWEKHNRLEPESFLFCGSPQEVVKTVLSGLTPIGACEENVLREVIASIPGRASLEDLVIVLETTKPAPTDPVLIHERFDPFVARSPVGQAAMDAVRDFYNYRRDPDLDAPRLVPGSDKAYQPLEEDLELTREYGW